MVKVAKLLIILLGIYIPAFAGIADLEQLIADAGSKPASQIPPQLPVFKQSATNFLMESGGNIFDSNRNDGTITDDYSHYNLTQLQMVGYLRYMNTDYAFLKTPYETLKVKVGDKILNGHVVSVTSNTIQIDEIQVQNSKVYNNKIFLALSQVKAKVLPKLQVK